MCESVCVFVCCVCVCVCVRARVCVCVCMCVRNMHTRAVTRKGFSYSVDLPWGINESQLPIPLGRQDTYLHSYIIALSSNILGVGERPSLVCNI